jgi:hypothetical protein
MLESLYVKLLAAYRDVRNCLAGQEGQALVEYALIVA